MELSSWPAAHALHSHPVGRSRIWNLGRTEHLHQLVQSARSWARLLFRKHIAEYYTREDFDRINRVLFSGLAFYGLFGILQVAVGLLLEKTLFNLFHVSGAAQAYFLILLSCALSNVAAMFLSVFKGIQRMDKSNSLEVKISIVNAIGTIVFLEFGWGMLGLAMNALVMPALRCCSHGGLSVEPCRRISVGWHFDGKLLRSMFAYGIKMQVSQVGGLICFRIDKLIVSRFLGIAAVSFYEFSSRMTSFMRALPLVMLSAVIPATSELGAKNDQARILRTYMLASKYVVDADGRVSGLPDCRSAVRDDVLGGPGF